MHTFDLRVSEAAKKRYSTKKVLFKVLYFRKGSVLVKLVRVVSSTKDEHLFKCFQGFCKNFKKFLVIYCKVN